MSMRQDLKSSWNWGIFKFQELLVVQEQWQKMFWFFRLSAKQLKWLKYQSMINLTINNQMEIS